MYPQRELIRLAAYKAALRRGIALRRAYCATAASRLAQPVAWLDRMVAIVRQLSPVALFAAVPLGVFVQRTVFPRMKILGTLARWGPLVVNAARGFGSMLRRSGEPSKRSQPKA